MEKKANEALLYAAESGCLRGVKAALKAGADIDYTQDNNVVTGTGTALFIASVDGNVGMVKLLLNKGASLTKRTSVSSSVPLHGAAMRGHTKVVEVLVRRGATVDIQDAFQKTPLMMACVFQHVDTVQRLIELGARVDLTDRCGMTARRYCEVDMIREECDCARREMLQLILRAMNSKLLRCCNPTCGKPGLRSKLKLCGQCKMTRYCSRDCQKQHWTVGHKKSCGHDAYRDAGPSPFEKMFKKMKRETSTAMCPVPGTPTYTEERQPPSQKVFIVLLMVLLWFSYSLFADDDSELGEEDFDSCVEVLYGGIEELM
ncbi:PREDICTED: ankyrin repeat and SOCS box protein 11-like isoform X1 [Branchiostoma belcheri]|uniref:Ankyrin repeat and SOCS box protein 11-like isoform X1 n=1 Tax=Branchiostoma belcheri TaxID=7741 RepID=A0A6P4YRB2_BRABE|nr:PREDICTED: ankyrin repeat and SOCS box protein 11-like isoform X1 [Branchiostoma belcheri]